MANKLDLAVSKAWNELSQLVSKSQATIDKGHMPDVDLPLEGLQALLRSLFLNMIKSTLGHQRPRIGVSAKRDLNQPSWLISIQSNAPTLNVPAIKETKDVLEELGIELIQQRVLKGSALVLRIPYNKQDG